MWHINREAYWLAWSSLRIKSWFYWNGYMATCFLQQAYTRRARDLVNFQFTAPPHMKIHSFMYSYPNKLHPSEYKYTHIQSVSQPVDQQTFCLCQLVVRRSKSCCVGYDVAAVAATTASFDYRHWWSDLLVQCSQSPASSATGNHSLSSPGTN